MNPHILQVFNSESNNYCELVVHYAMHSYFLKPYIYSYDYEHVNGSTCTCTVLVMFSKPCMTISKLSYRFLDVYLTAQ